MPGRRRMADPSARVGLDVRDGKQGAFVRRRDHGIDALRNGMKPLAQFPGRAFGTTDGGYCVDMRLKVPVGGHVPNEMECFPLEMPGLGWVLGENVHDIAG